MADTNLSNHNPKYHQTMPTKKTKTRKPANTRKVTKAKRKISPAAKKKLAASGTRIMTAAKKLYNDSGKKTAWTKCVSKAAKALKK